MMMGGAPFVGILALLFYIAIPAVVLYFVIKFAIKNAIKELKDDEIL